MAFLATALLTVGCTSIRDVGDLEAELLAPDHCLDTIVVGDFQRGTGASGSPYLICNLDQLNHFTTFCNTTSPSCTSMFFQLGADIDLAAAGNNGAFTPIKVFQGTFDGNNKTISNWLYTAANLADPSGTIEADIGQTIQHPDFNLGFFRKLDAGGVVKNLALADVALQGRFYTGALVGYMVAGSSVQNCSASTNGNVADVGDRTKFAGMIVGYNNLVTGGASGHTGGLIGAAEAGTTITSSSFSGVVRGAMSVGGFVGQLLGSTVSNCHSSGAVFGSDGNEGGLIGTIDDNGAGGITAVSLSYSTANVVTTSTSIGGLVGSMVDRSTITTSYFNGDVSGGSIMGGIAGNMTGSTTSITKSFAVGTVNGGAVLGGLVGLMYDSGSGGATLSDSFAMNTITFTAGNMWNFYVGGAGGAVGCMHDAGTVNRVYAAGSIVDHTGAVSVNSGDLVGGSSTTATPGPVGTRIVTDSFADTAVSANGFVGSGAINLLTVSNSSSLTTANMKISGSYFGWDFNTVWQMSQGTNNGYPTLR